MDLVSIDPFPSRAGFQKTYQLNLIQSKSDKFIFYLIQLNFIFFEIPNVLTL